MTPYYDVLSAWPIIGKGQNHLAWQKAELAMAVRSKNAHWKLKDIQPRHWRGAARAAGLQDADALIEEVLAQVPLVLEKVGDALPKKFPIGISGKIFDGIRQQARTLAGM
jgi:serine/threonine-protein kinase HipA